MFVLRKWASPGKHVGLNLTQSGNSGEILSWPGSDFSAVKLQGKEVNSHSILGAVSYVPIAARVISCA